ncbi:hypothetical protein EV421DRAFT_1788902 [Armillaria borealis]|uniref:Uncharacterized protein n=1 Tax=Armillaria borealis TaxID=47425 RepID=A0AA39MV34_9AGAR|nr:hypothetical protein EV421DRAFT_1788902 [Armillaria borealis]
MHTMAYYVNCQVFLFLLPGFPATGCFSPTAGRDGAWMFGSVIGGLGLGIVQMKVVMYVFTAYLLPLSYT